MAAVARSQRALYIPESAEGSWMALGMIAMMRPRMGMSPRGLLVYSENSPKRVEGQSRGRSYNLGEDAESLSLGAVKIRTSILAE
jgi:hypothetical protein